MSNFAFIEGAIDEARATALREALLASPLVARSTLAGSFQGSRGFAITFTSEGRAELLRRFPFLDRFVELAIDSRPERMLARFWQRPPAANAWYLNLLMLSDGGAVGRHLDGTLREPSGVADAVPLVVSVLYLSAGSAGGELVLHRGHACVGEIRPQVGAMLHFRGDLDHEIRKVEGSRISLVCEQYALPSVALGRLKPLQVQSKGGFAAYLTDHESRSNPSR